MAKQKYYVVWVGNEPGIYDTWNACKAQVSNFPSAKYKSFKTRAEAEAAFHQPYQEKQSNKKRPLKHYLDFPEVDKSAIAVDAACSGNPGNLEYRGVKVNDKSEIFRMGPFNKGTNNVGEFLALVHALALLDKLGDEKTRIYSDSKIAIGWIKKGRANTKLKKSRVNSTLFILLNRAEKWLATHKWKNPITKWETKKWGEIPADFGRK